MDWDSIVASDSEDEDGTTGDDDSCSTSLADDDIIYFIEKNTLTALLTTYSFITLPTLSIYYYYLVCMKKVSISIFYFFIICVLWRCRSRSGGTLPYGGRSVTANSGNIVFPELAGI